MVTRTLAGGLAGVRPLPTALRAVLGYYADTGVFDYRSLSLKSTVDERTEAMIEDAFADVEAALADAFDRETVAFSYDTKLVLPAQLTLGYVYRQARRRSDTDPVGDEIATGLPAVEDTAAEQERLGPRAAVVRAERMTRLAVRALIDGDMRDAINDEEFEDFAVDFPTDEADRRRIAEIAQATLQADLAEALDVLPERVRTTYDDAVAHSEAHQARDPHFRDLMARAEDGDADARAAIRREYRDADFRESPFETAVLDLDLPYLKTQYARVGVLYDAMLELYRQAGLGIDAAFARSIVLAIVGAQVWLDDVDDYPDDRAAGQLTPVTAEYLLAADDAAAYEAVLEVTEEYLDLAKTDATRADSPLTGIAIEYIYRSGDPGVLPGSG